MRHLLVTALLSLLGQGGNAHADEGDIGYPSVEAARKALSERDDISMSRADGWLTIEDPAAMTLWTFTPETDPAHPAAIKRSVIEEAGRVVLRMDIRCEGDAAACDALEAHFLSLNEAAVGRAGNEPEGDEPESDEPESDPPSD